MPKTALRRSCSLLIASVAISLPVLVSATSPPITQPTGVHAREFTFLAAGDLLGPYQTNLKLDDSSFAKVVNIVKEADVAFANHEGSTFDLATFGGSPGAGKINAVPPHSLATARALKEMGFDLLSRANNHTTDWGVEGALASDRTLDAIGIVHAGTGRSLEAARAPAYFHSARGRVALIASASTFVTDAPAGDPSLGGGPRPGLNPLRLRQVRLITPEEMSTLRQMFSIETHVGVTGKQELYLGQVYRESNDKRGLTYEVSRKDRAAIINSIATARHSSDFVVYSIHAHEARSGYVEMETEPGDFLIPLFHDIVDAGADVVVRSGPHIVQGIEIYRGKPIFYGLGQFFHELPRTWVVPNEGWENVTIEFPAEYYESAVASSEFSNGILRTITIYPLIIDARETSVAFGIPKLAQGADARRILERFQQRSVQFGTKIDIVNGLGIVKGPATL